MSQSETDPADATSQKAVSTDGRIYASPSSNARPPPSDPPEFSRGFSSLADDMEQAESAGLFMRRVASSIQDVSKNTDIIDKLLSRVAALESKLDLQSSNGQASSPASTLPPSTTAVTTRRSSQTFSESPLSKARRDSASSAAFSAMSAAPLDFGAMTTASGAAVDPAIMQTLQALQERFDREFDSVRFEISELQGRAVLANQAPETAAAEADLFDQVMLKQKENQRLVQRIEKMETRHHKAARHAKSERATNAKRIRALEEIIQEMVENKGRVRKSRTLGVAAAQQELKQDNKLTRKGSSLVSAASLERHTQDMKNFRGRTKAAVAIQRSYRKRLDRRNWPEIDFRAMIPDDVKDKDSIEIEVDDAVMVDEDADAKKILRKLNGHTNSIVSLQSHINEFSKIMKRDREENRKLHDEMVDYIESCTSLTADMKDTHVKVARLMEGSMSVQAEIVLLQKDCQSIRLTAQEHYDDMEIHRVSHSAASVSAPRIDLIEHKLNAHQQLLDVLGNSVDGSAVQDSVHLANKRHQEVSDKLIHIQKVMQQICDTAEDAQEKAKTVGRRVDDLKSRSTGNLEAGIKSLGVRMSDLFSGHQTLSGSVQHLQRHVHTILDRPKDSEREDKLEAKISLIWRAKADRDEVDRAITRAVNTLLTKLPVDDVGAGDGGPLLATWSCLGCGKKHKEMATAQSEEAHSQSGMLGSKSRVPEVLFGKLKSLGDSSQYSTAQHVPPLAQLSNPAGGMPPINSKAQTARESTKGRQMTAGATGGRGPSGFNPRSTQSPKARKAAEGFTASQPLPHDILSRDTSPISRGMRGSKTLSATSPPNVSSVHYYD